MYVTLSLYIRVSINLRYHEGLEDQDQGAETVLINESKKCLLQLASQRKVIVVHVINMGLALEEA